jgi:hypothetical protein
MVILLSSLQKNIEGASADYEKSIIRHINAKHIIDYKLEKSFNNK